MRLDDYECQSCKKIVEYFRNEVPPTHPGGCGGILQRLFPSPTIVTGMALRSKSRGPRYDLIADKELSDAEVKDVSHQSEPKYIRDRNEVIKEILPPDKTLTVVGDAREIKFIP